MTAQQRRELHALCQAYRTEPLGPACEYTAVSGRYAAIERFVCGLEREMLEKAAALCERVRCRVWSPKECAEQIRKLAMSGEV